MSRLLLVDDDPEILTYLRTILEKEGYECRTARSTCEILAIAREEPVDQKYSIAIVDLILGDENGMDTAAQLVEACPALDILMMSGYAGAVVSTTLPNGKKPSFIPKASLPTQLRKVLKEIHAC